MKTIWDTYIKVYSFRICIKQGILKLLPFISVLNNSIIMGFTMLRRCMDKNRKISSSMKVEQVWMGWKETSIYGLKNGVWDCL